MGLPIPNLDDRRFQDFVDEAKRRIPRYCPSWTDHNVSDPGITLIELFAWMADQCLYRLNQVPDKNFIVFLDLIGVRLEPAHAATGDVTFTLSTRLERPMAISGGIEVATESGQGQEPVVVTTDRGLELIPAVLTTVLTSPDDRGFTDRSRVLNDQTAFDAFSTPPVPGNAFYLGFEDNLKAMAIVVDLDCAKAAIGIDPRRPPRAWEYWNGESWQALDVGNDSTLGFNQRGEILIHVPYDAKKTQVDRQERFWIRCRVIPTQPGQPSYAAPPRIFGLNSYTIGGSVPATHAHSAGPEILGTSDGTPGQVFTLQNRPVLGRRADEVIEVGNDESWEAWKEVNNFATSGIADRHYTLEGRTGEVRFGPSVRRPDGSELPFGAIPPRGATIRMRRYRTGGGVVGNISAGRLSVLKTAIPYIASVTNRYAITGGTDPEGLDHAKLRGPQMLRTRFRAVTAEDYEYLALEATDSVARAYCLQAGEGDPPVPPGTVRLLVVPSLPPGTDQPLEDQLALAPANLQILYDYLNERRLLATRLEISAPSYVWATVEAQVRPLGKADPGRVVRDVERALYRFIHPLWGGPDGYGWPFGRPLTISEVYAVIQGVEGVAYATDVKLFAWKGPKRKELGPASQILQLPPLGLFCSYQHNIRATSEREEVRYATTLAH